MLDINTEFRKGILFIRLNGYLNKDNLHKVIKIRGFNYIVFNIDNLYAIDTYGIDFLLNINKKLQKEKGKLLICDKNYHKDYIFGKIPKINNELEAFKLYEEDDLDGYYAYY